MKYSAKLVYKNYFAYFFHMIRGKRIFSTLFAGVLLGNSIYLVLNYFNCIDKISNLFIYPLLNTIYWSFNLFSIFVFIVSLIFWNQIFEIVDGNIIDYFPIKKKYSFNDIQRVVLSSKTQAAIMLKSENSKFIHSVIWFGHNMDDWINFIRIIKNHRADIENSIYYETRGRQSNIIKSTPEDCYLKASDS